MLHTTFLTVVVTPCAFALVLLGVLYFLVAIYLGKMMKEERERREQYDRMRKEMEQRRAMAEMHERAKRIMAKGNDLDLSRSYDRLKAQAFASLN